MGHGPIIGAFDLVVKDKLVQDTARINRYSSFIKDMCKVADLDHFDELVNFLKNTGYLLKSQEEKIEINSNEDYLINEIPN